MFNVVLYASDVWTWADDLAEMSADARAEVTEYVEEVGAVGGTNIYGALERAFDLAGAGAGDEGDWSDPEIDTIYLLTSGEPEVGLYVHGNRISEFLAELNRFQKVTVHAVAYSPQGFWHHISQIAAVTGGEFQGFQ